MRLAWFALVLLALACRESEVATSTIAPAEPRPGRTVTAAADSRRAITTTGSPRPASAAAPGTQFITVSEKGIQMQALVPVGQTAFLVKNETGARHDLLLRGAAASATLALAPRGSGTMQIVLRGEDYEVVCLAPGHAESARFTTYVPGPGFTTSS